MKWPIIWITLGVLLIMFNAIAAREAFIAKSWFGFGFDAIMALLWAWIIHLELKKIKAINEIRRRNNQEDYE